MGIRQRIEQVMAKLKPAEVLCPNGACSYLGPGVPDVGGGDGICCARCRSPLPGQPPHRIIPSPIALLGGVGAGKTVWLLRSLGALTQREPGQDDMEARFSLPEQPERFSRSHSGLKMGRWPVPTPEAVPTAWCIHLVTPKRPLQLYLYDPAGTECREAARLNRHRYLERLRGIVFVVDPFVLPGVREKYASQLKHTRTNLRPSATVLEDVVSALLQAVRHTRGHGGPGPMDLPVAVLLSKTDAFDLWRQIDAVQRSIQADSPSAAEGQASRQCLVAWGGGNAIRALEHHFNPVAYFRCRPEATGLHGPPRPLLWLLGLEPQP